MLYLLDATGFYSLGLHALGIQVCRATGQELVQCSKNFFWFFLVYYCVFSGKLAVTLCFYLLNFVAICESE